MHAFATFKRPTLLLALLTAMLLSPLAAGADEAPANDAKAMVEQVKQIEQELKWGRYDVKALTDRNKLLTDFTARANTCVERNTTELTKVETALKQLGKRRPGESAEVSKQRLQHEGERQTIETTLADCKALALHLTQVQETLAQQLKRRLEERMFARGPDIFTVTGSLLTEPLTWFADSGRYLKNHSWLLSAATPREIGWVLAALALGLGLGLWLRWQGMRAAVRRAASKPGGAGTAILSSCCHDAPYVLPSLAAAIVLAVLTYTIRPVPVSAALVYGLTAFFIANLAIRISFEPAPPGRLFLDLPEAIVHPMARRLRILMLLVLVVIPLVDTALVQGLPDFARALAHTVVRVLLAINILWVLWLFRYLRGIKRQAWFRRLLSLVLIVAVIADLIGYSNLSGWLFRSVFGSLVAVAVVTTLARLLRELLVAVEYGATPWGRRMRKLLRLPPTEEHLAGIFWIRMLVTFGWWTLLAWMLILIWDLSANVVQDIVHIMTDGFVIGSLKIVPARVALAVVVLIALIAVTTWLKGLIKLQLEKSPMERGSREALVTVSGYSGVIIALVVALGIAGIQFANLAIIVGALSVGIGFGLQNIVNNFLSGLILLVERPVKTGDWIVVGGTEGYVKRIRIRSTQIQTFDLADVIVPNSELISSQVTNWMLRDTTGRARVPVGVAYGSDTQRVKEILLKIANEHPEIITNRKKMEPFVLFIGFGDSALEFELRVYIRNIDNRLRVKSDLNFAIDAAFREAGIEIPFPQRDVHIKQGPSAPGGA